MEERWASGNRSRQAQRCSGCSAMGSAQCSCRCTCVFTKGKVHSKAPFLGSTPGKRNAQYIQTASKGSGGMEYRPNLRGAICVAATVPRSVRVLRAG